jgi:hypothetical protein
VRVLVACEFSGVVRDAFLRAGHEAYSCDLIEGLTFHPNHIVGDAIEVAYGQHWDLMIAHPPCTYMARSGWHWVSSPDSSVEPLKGEPRRRAAHDAAYFFRRLLDAPVARIAVENPRPIKHVGLPKETQVIQPWQFGHGEVKATCLWLRNLPMLAPTDVVQGRDAVVHKQSPGIRNGLTRQQRRSITYRGIAEAMAEQWGKL